MNLKLQMAMIGVLVSYFTLQVSAFPLTIIQRDPVINQTAYDTYPNLLKLDMSNLRSFKFPADGVLLVHSSLSQYLCNHCSVESVYEQSLSKLPSLFLLELNDNYLNYIHPDAFQHNHNLTKVGLANNNLVQFNPEATLRSIPALKILDLTWNSHFDMNAVNIDAQRLERLKCDHCSTTSLLKSTLRKTPKLLMLSMTYNQLNQVDENAFESLDRLKILNLDGNRDLQTLNIKSDTLEQLNATGCGLQGRLDTSQLPKLKKINVRNNRIQRLYEHGFANNINLRVVLLDDNEIRKVPEKLMQLAIIRLKILCFDQNLLQPSEMVLNAKEMYSSQGLRRGCLDDGNHLKKFENYLPSRNGVAVYKKQPIHDWVEGTQIVDLSSRSIAFIETDYLEDVTNATELLFDNNKQFDFPRFVVFLQSVSIQRLSMRNCSITDIPKQTFYGLPNLVFVDLEENMIKTIIATTLFQKSPNIIHLNLARNSLEYIDPKALEHLEQLETLNVEQNTNLVIDEGKQFLNSASLLKLYFSHCGLDRLDSITLFGLPKITVLDLENNQITTLDQDAFQWTPRLRHLNLANNLLNTFAPSLDRLRDIETVCLAGNLDFNIALPESEVPIEQVQKIKQLGSNCRDQTFTAKPDELARKRSQLDFTESGAIVESKLKRSEKELTTQKNILEKIKSSAYNGAKASWDGTCLIFIICFVKKIVG